MPLKDFPPNDTPLVTIREAAFSYGSRLVWSGLNLTIAPGEFVAVLGANGAGKTSLLKVMLGLASLSAGTVLIENEAPRKGRAVIGYVPQQKAFDPYLPVRGIDLVGYGLTGHRYGFGGSSRDAVEEAIREVGASAFAHKPIGKLSGGEQQRLRIAQALLSNPRLLLCDEPLLSLDISQRRVISALIETRRDTHKTAIVFVTHDVNPVLRLVDRVLYLADGRWAIGTPEEVLTNQTLSRLYNAPVEVVRVKGRIIVLGAGEEGTGEEAAQSQEVTEVSPAPLPAAE